MNGVYVLISLGSIGSTNRTKGETFLSALATRYLYILVKKQEAEFFLILFYFDFIKL